MQILREIALACLLPEALSHSNPQQMDSQDSSYNREPGDRVCPNFVLRLAL